MTSGKILAFVPKILVCLLVGSLVWLFKTITVKVLASSFHVNTFFHRIQECLFNQYLIKTLSVTLQTEVQKSPRFSKAMFAS